MSYSETANVIKTYSSFNLIIYGIILGLLNK